jgi:hypothetical protein
MHNIVPTLSQLVQDKSMNFNVMTQKQAATNYVVMSTSGCRQKFKDAP